MIYLLKTLIVLFILGWTALGGWMALKHSALFGPHRDNPSETVGARSFGVAQIWAVWIGVLALAIYFLFC
jgi:hypothetical protein